jgi:hypothetical protein
MSSIRNIIVVAIMQVGVIVAGVLAAGICHRVWSSEDMAMPVAVAMVYRHGFVGLLIPVVWGTGTVALYLRANISEEIKTLVFWFGVLILIVSAAFIIYADATPWLNGPMWHAQDNGDQ